MPTEPEDLRDEVDRMREALRRAVRESSLSDSRIEQALGLRAGELSALLTGKADLRVAHVFRILKVIGMEPWRLFLELCPEGELARYVA